MTVSVRKITAQEDLDHAFAIRRKVFVEEQQVDEREEYDQFEDSSTHYLATVDGQPAGTARWREVGDKVKLERFAVLPEYRGTGAGKALVLATLEDARKVGKPIYLHAQMPVVDFYQKLGFRAYGEEFIEAGIRHLKMEFAG